MKASCINGILVIVIYWFHRKPYNAKEMGHMEEKRLVQQAKAFAFVVIQSWEDMKRIKRENVMMTEFFTGRNRHRRLCAGGLLFRRKRRYADAVGEGRGGLFLL